MQDLIRLAKETYWLYAKHGAWDLGPLIACLRREKVSLDGVTLRIRSDLSFNVIKALLRGDYETSERRFLKDCVLANDTVMELGAGLGFMSTYCARITGSHKVFTYEANPDMHKIIMSTYRLNDVSPNLRIGICGDSEGTADFYVARDFWASSIEPSQGLTKISVPKIQFDKEIMKIRPTVIIIDIEGGEYDLLFQSDFGTCRAMLIELHPMVLGPVKIAEALARVSALGFETVNRDGDTYLLERRAQ